MSKWIEDLQKEGWSERELKTQSMTYKTVCVQIGNSDDKLSQKEWSKFVGQVGGIVSAHAYVVHYKGTSHGCDPWQNACWVMEMKEVEIPAFLSVLKAKRGGFGQDSAAVLIGSTEMI